MKCYLYLYNYIYNSILENKFYFYYITENKYIVKIRDCSVELQAAVSAEKIIDNLPFSFEILLDDILRANKYKEEFAKFIFDPTIILKGINMNFFERSNSFKFVCDIVNDYFEKQKKLDCFIERFENDLIEKRYIASAKIYEYLGIQEPDSKKLFKYYEFNEINEALQLNYIDKDIYKYYSFMDVSEVHSFINSLSELIEINDNAEKFIPLKYFIKSS